MCAQNYALGTHTKFQLGIRNANVISGQRLFWRARETLVKQPPATSPRVQSVKPSREITTGLCQFADSNGDGSSQVIRNRINMRPVKRYEGLWEWLAIHGEAINAID